MHLICISSPRSVYEDKVKQELFQRARGCKVVIWHNRKNILWQNDALGLKIAKGFYYMFNSLFEK